MIAASILTSRALAPVEQVVGQWRGFLGFRQAFARIRKVLEEAPSTRRALDLPLPSKSVAALHFATGPREEDPPLIADVTFELQAGEAMGVLGLSGSGKSSLLRGITGVWPRLRGEIRLDGSELSHFDHDRLGRAIGYLPQTVDLFDGTIAENIARFRPEASTEAILGAAMASGAHDLVKTMPNGYDTRIGPRGATLSAGQRQRIGLARALFGDPFLIALDEPNSNLDADGEAAVTEAILRAKERGAVVIVVAHRPSVIEAVDSILFVQEGLQRAYGPRDEILARIIQQPTSIGPDSPPREDG
jgi:ABC-type protease/lipase transport system fused ATPase/permease subunit